MTAADRAAGFAYQLSILQMEVSRTQVFTRPLRGREFFEEVLRDQLDLGRPTRMQLLFPRKITRATPGRFRTRVVTHGVIPSLHVEYKRCHIKQYFKEGRALRTETTFNDTHDFGVGRGLRNFAYLRTLGQHINTRLLEPSSGARLRPRGRAARRAGPPQPDPRRSARPGLKFGEPRVMALLGALCLVRLTPRASPTAASGPWSPSCSASRPTVHPPPDGLRPAPPGPQGPDHRVPGKLCYTLTPCGRRVALFLTKLYARVLRPGLQALDRRGLAVPPPLRRAFAAVDATWPPHSPPGSGSASRAAVGRCPAAGPSGAACEWASILLRLVNNVDLG